MSKIDNPEYMWYVVCGSGILTGNEYKEDAKDAMRDMPESYGPFKVYSRKYLVDMGLDPSQNRNWTQDQKASIKNPDRTGWSLASLKKYDQFYLECVNTAKQIAWAEDVSQQSEIKNSLVKIAKIGIHDGIKLRQYGAK